jgi:hypothetical protein
MKHLEPPIGILVTLPVRFFEEYGMDNYERDIQLLNEDEDELWYRVMKNLPTQEVLYIYTVYGGKVQHRTLFAGILRNQNFSFVRPRDNSVKNFPNSNAVIMCGPVVKAPFDIPMKGFQGFRYVTKELW